MRDLEHAVDLVPAVDVTWIEYPLKRASDMSAMNRLLSMCLLVGLSSGCATVAAYEREYLSDATMQPVVDPLEARASRQLHLAREAAGGGDATAAGGGCGCSN
jgi:hypothetical protein